MNTIGGIRTQEPKMEVLAGCIQSIEESRIDACLQSYVDKQENLQDRVDVLTENLEKVRQDNLELKEEIAGLKAQKIDLVNHLEASKFLFDSMCYFNGTWDYKRKTCK